MKVILGAFALASALNVDAVAAQSTKPTIVLVHGAFADSSGWSSVIMQLNDKGFPTIAAPNGLRSLAADAAEVAALVRSIEGDVVLVGHSYGGLVITEAAGTSANVRALVYVAGFIPDIGESAAVLSSKFPGGTLGDTLEQVALPDGGIDLYIDPEKFHAQFAADVATDTARLMAQTQRPITQQALADASTAAPWKTIPSFTVYGSADRNIPPAAQAFMADRAKAVRAVQIDGASHVLMISHPAEVVALIEQAAAMP
jgi:pimeloyl-ACP methyl ester carboxylesterase